MATDYSKKDLTNIIIAEGDTPQISFQLIDSTETGIPLGSVNTMTLTIYEENSLSIINSMQDVDIKNTNNGTLDGSGNVVYTIQTGDTAIVGPRTREQSVEIHVFQFKFVYNTTRQLTQEILVAIRNLPLVT